METTLFSPGSVKFYPAPSRKRRKPRVEIEPRRWEWERPALAWELSKRGEYKLASRIEYCRKKVVRMKCLKYFEGPRPEHDSELRLPYCCHTSACPECSRLYSAEKSRELLSYLEGFRVPKGFFLQFGTLTKKVNFSTQGNRRLPEQEELKLFFKQVREFVNEFFPRNDFNRGGWLVCCDRECKKNHRTRCCKKNCEKEHRRKGAASNSGRAGALGVLEIGRGDNLHVHLLAVGPAYSRSRMSRRWLEITGDSYILEFEPVRGTLVEKGKKPNLASAIGEVLKYIRKPVQFDSFADTAEMLVLFKNFRRIHTFGIFYNPHAAGGIVENVPRPEKSPLCCEECGQKFAFYSFDEQELWWDEASYKSFYALDG